MLAPLWAAAQSGAIYTCVDAQGRRHTSDRPITACLDREQEQRSNTGTVKRVIPPSYTAEERARLEADKRAEEERTSRVAEERRRERALLVRYPTPAVHDKERADALAQVDEVIAAVKKRSEDLVKRRAEIDTEMEFYQRDPSKAPAWLRRNLEDNIAQTKSQERFLQEQIAEKQRINARFDEERGRLRRLWMANGVATDDR
jgi:hypothetical protein